MWWCKPENRRKEKKMEIIDEAGNEIFNPNLELGYLINDIKTIHHDKVDEVKEKFHYETIAEYPNGGKDVKKIVDVEEVKAKDAWDEEIPIQKYILYTAEELEAKLNEIKNAKIAKSKTDLKEYLASHPLQWIDGEYYSVTEEKQALLTSNLAAYQISSTIGEPMELTWNTTGDRCRAWTYENLAALSLAIVKYVKPIVSKQQDIEVKIKECKSKNEVDNIEIKYE
jgi:hypothetical protein